jgi:hypothetical protein
VGKKSSQIKLQGSRDAWDMSLRQWFASNRGSLATILWLIALRKEKLDVSFWDLAKAALPSR